MVAKARSRFLHQGRRNDFQSGEAWLTRMEISSAKNNETCYFLKKGDQFPPRPSVFDALVHALWLLSVESLPHYKVVLSANGDSNEDVKVKTLW